MTPEKGSHIPADAFIDLQSRGRRLVKPNNTTALSNGPHTLLANDQLRNKLGRQGRQSVHENFNASKMAESVLKVFHRLTNRAV